MSKTHVGACFSLLVAVATIITQVPKGQESEVRSQKSESEPRPVRQAQGRPQGSGGLSVSHRGTQDVSKQRLVETYGRLPLSFVANHGQSDGSVKFLSRGNGYTLFLTANEAVLTLRRSQESEVRSQNPSRARQQAVNPQITQITPIVTPEAARSLPSAPSAKSVEEPSGSSPVTRHSSLLHTVLRMKLVGANPNPEVTGENELPGKSSYFIGNDPSKWRTNVPTYAKVKYEEVYPGIDLVYYGNPGAPGQLEYDFVVAPGADPRAIRLAFPSVGSHGTSFVPWVLGRNEPERAHGIKSMPWLPQLRIDAQGDLVLEASEGSELRLHQPVIYQEIGGPVPAGRGARQRIGGNFVIFDATANEGGREVGFEVAQYDASKPLIIDPVLVYSTYLGGSNSDSAAGITVDASGNVYVTGNTVSTDFPTASPLQSNCNNCFPGSPGSSDAFVMRLNAAGSAVVYSTYLGGSDSDISFGIAVDPSGNAYVTGRTRSTNFPTASPFQGTSRPGSEVFVAKLNPTGNALVYATYLGGSVDDFGYGIAVDSSGSAYVTGGTSSTDFPTANPFQGALGGFIDVFVAKLSPAGNALVYSTYLGGSNEDTPFRIAVDSSGNAYVTGDTLSANFPTANPLQSACNNCSPGSLDAFVAKLSAGGNALLYSTYLGGSRNEFGTGIAVDSTGNTYVTGLTRSADFPTAGPLQAVLGGPGDAFVAKLSAAGNALVYSTYLGGSGLDIGWDIAVDSSGSAYVGGGTSSTNFPTANAFQAAYGGGDSEAFLAKLNAAGSALVYSTYLGGSVFDSASGIAVDSSGNAYLTGTTRSSNFPTANAFQPALGGAMDRRLAHAQCRLRHPARLRPLRRRPWSRLEPPSPPSAVTPISPMAASKRFRSRTIAAGGWCCFSGRSISLSPARPRFAPTRISVTTSTSPAPSCSALASIPCTPTAPVSDRASARSDCPCWATCRIPSRSTSAYSPTPVPPYAPPSSSRDVSPAWRQTTSTSAVRRAKRCACCTPSKAARSPPAKGSPAPRPSPTEKGKTMQTTPPTSLLVAALVMLRHPCARNQATAQLLLKRAAEHTALTPAEREACLELADTLDRECPEPKPMRPRPAPHPAFSFGWPPGNACLHDTTASVA